jgi:hypothetical protein
MRLVVLAVVMIVAWPSSARADDDLLNFTIGPVFALRLSGPEGSKGVIGIEGGVGYGPERINIGFEHRSDHDVGYVEFDPWYIIGGTLGVAINDENEASGVFGVWEGLPIAGFEGSCSGWHNIATIAGGYRYTGVHELFVTLKAGRMNGNVCFD